ncbi:hypothetical protein HK405_003753, partial [Cladochytrium tenue]
MTYPKATHQVQACADAAIAPPAPAAPRLVACVARSAASVAAWDALFASLPPTPPASPVNATAAPAAELTAEQPAVGVAPNPSASGPAVAQSTEAGRLEQPDEWSEAEDEEEEDEPRPRATKNNVEPLVRNGGSVLSVLFDGAIAGVTTMIEGLQRAVRKGGSNNAQTAAVIADGALKRLHSGQVTSLAVVGNKPGAGSEDLTNSGAFTAKPCKMPETVLAQVRPQSAPDVRRVSRAVVAVPPLAIAESTTDDADRLELTPAPVPIRVSLKAAEEELKMKESMTAALDTLLESPGLASAPSSAALTQESTVTISAPLSSRDESSLVTAIRRDTEPTSTANRPQSPERVANFAARSLIPIRMTGRPRDWRSPAAAAAAVPLTRPSRRAEGLSARVVAARAATLMSDARRLEDDGVAFCGVAGELI